MKIARRMNLLKKIDNLNELNRNYFSISEYRSTDFPDDL